MQAEKLESFVALTMKPKKKSDRKEAIKPKCKTETIDRYIVLRTKLLICLAIEAKSKNQETKYDDERMYSHFISNT